MLRVVTLPFCRVAMAAPWNEPPRRRFAAYRCRGSFRRLLGHAVVDEFATLSSPVFFAPGALAGRIYDAGLSLALRRDAEMGIDGGWPPLVVGLETPAPELPAGWEELLLRSLARAPEPGEPLAGADSFERLAAGPYRLERVVLGESTLCVTDAPLLPRQLARLAETAASPLSLAWSVGNAIAPAPAGTPATVDAVSEERLASLVAALSERRP